LSNYLEQKSPKSKAEAPFILKKNMKRRDTLFSTISFTESKLAEGDGLPPLTEETEEPEPIVRKKRDPTEPAYLAKQPLSSRNRFGIESRSTLHLAVNDSRQSLFPPSQIDSAHDLSGFIREFEALKDMRENHQMSKLLSIDRSNLRQADTYSMLRERISNSKPAAVIRAQR
jgi:hypothetical protein